MTKKELLKYKERKWDDTKKEYDYILIVPTGTKHDSGYMHIAIIGVTKNKSGEEYEICGYPDDISCIFPVENMGDFKYSLVRMDCYYPSGVLRYHGNGKFRVSEAVSSMEIYFRKIV